MNSDDDWIYLDCPNDLKKQAQKYIKHLGTDDLFDLGDFLNPTSTVSLTII